MPALPTSPDRADAQTGITDTPLDVLIVGAGLSGIGAARRLQQRCPNKQFLIIEARHTLGGTWDLFRYPGIRSDSDMFTLSYPFKPWRSAQSIVDGPSIRRYIQDAADEAGITDRIRFGWRVVSAAWSSQTALWTVLLQRSQANGQAHATDAETRQVQARFLYACAGYYSYSDPYRPEFPDESRFQGQIIHPQFWPENLDLSGKRVVVIGSGATAVTLIPSLTHSAMHVTMLQRSPTYVVNRPGRDTLAAKLQSWLPVWAANRLIRLKNIAQSMVLFRLARRRPTTFRERLIDMARTELGTHCDVDQHFAPHYAPWDQRVCVVPDGDLFAAIRAGRASVVTDTIDRFTDNGILLASGQHLPADVIVTATGLRLQMLGGIALDVDGQTRDVHQAMIYRGMMLSGIPNLALAFGYTNASWTLKADLTACWVCRLLNRMDREAWAIALPQPDPQMPTRPFMEFTSGYVQRAQGVLPQQGVRPPWRMYQNYLLDTLMIRYSRLDDGVLRLSPAASNNPALP